MTTDESNRLPVLAATINAAHDEDDNRPPEDWPVPECGVDRFRAVEHGMERAQEGVVTAIALEIATHFKAKRKLRAAADIEAILADAKPSNHLLAQIYRHAFHPVLAVTIGEALACPEKTRREQLEAAFVPVVGAARRIEWKPPKPFVPRKSKLRKRSVNPATKDYQKFVSRAGRHLAWHATSDDRRFYGPIEKQLADQQVQTEHLAPVLEVARAEARRQVEWAERDLKERREALAAIELDAARLAKGGATDP